MSVTAPARPPMEEIASRSSTLSTAKLPSGEARGASNLRRCTGYDEIVRAVLDAAAELRARLATPAKCGHSVGDCERR
jgi:xanthine dehydrogenase iron-sulfur cluster and FAD-binding subunit A